MSTLAEIEEAIETLPDAEVEFLIGKKSPAVLTFKPTDLERSSNE